MFFEEYSQNLHILTLDFTNRNDRQLKCFTMFPCVPNVKAPTFVPPIAGQRFGTSFTLLMAWYAMALTRCNSPCSLVSRSLEAKHHRNAQHVTTALEPLEVVSQPLKITRNHCKAAQKSPQILSPKQLI